MIQRIAPCRGCGGTTLWRHRTRVSPWICGVCLPPELEPDVLEWHEAWAATALVKSFGPPARPTPPDIAVVIIRRIQRLPVSLWRHGSLYWVDLAIGRSRLKYVLVRREPSGKRRLVLSDRHPLARLDDERRRILASPTSCARVEAAVLAEIVVRGFA